MYRIRQQISSYPVPPSNKDFVDPLDIRNIGHEAIKNDPELRESSRNPAGLFDLVDNLEDEGYNDYDLLEDDEDEDEDNDEYLYPEEETVVNYSKDEIISRQLVSRASTLLNQNVPGTPKRISSFFSTKDDYNNDIHNDIHEANQKIKNNNNKRNNGSINWAEYIKFGLSKAFIAIAFLIFMIYWMTLSIGI